MQQGETVNIGIDVGSTTAKIAIIDQTGELLFSRYERHNAKTNELLLSYLKEISERFNNPLVRICTTGSVGMAIAEQLQSEFVQEVVAATEYVRHKHPEVKSLIDIGGEDAKVVFFGKKSQELRMNGNCAGGTGAFLDQMSVLMGIDNKTMNDLAMNAKRIHPMAARCGVFAKTDIQNLMARNIPKEEVAASIFHSIAVQTITSLSHGCEFKPPILLCGGPLTFMPALRKAFADYLHLSAETPLPQKESDKTLSNSLSPVATDSRPWRESDKILSNSLPIQTADSRPWRESDKTLSKSLSPQATDFIFSGNSNMIPAMGCALRAKGEPVRVSELLHRISSVKVKFKGGELSPLFTSEEEHIRWREEKDRYALKTDKLRTDNEEPLYIGIDSGSTTTKIVAARKDGTVVFDYYGQNFGNPIHAVEEGLKQLQLDADKKGVSLYVAGSCSTGYGEELIKTAFNLDYGIIETMAHYKAASRLVPDVSFILDIGGQDMKAIFVENGTVVRMELNEACSSGCGTFLQTFANNLGYTVEEFANAACTAKAPCDLGTRCTVFMNSKVKQVMRERESDKTLSNSLPPLTADISAGLSYSVVKNCLYKVLKLQGYDDFGKTIVVQGGTMRNDSVVRAFELLTGKSVVRSNKPELMGAYGCALHAIDLQENVDVNAKQLSSLLEGCEFSTRQTICKGCENNCIVSQYTFSGKRKFYSGNKCERIFNNYDGNHHQGENIFPEKYELIFGSDSHNSPEDNQKPTIGIPRILNMYEEYPFWRTLFTACGFTIQLSSQSTIQHYERALNSVMSDNICFPAKLVHSHIKELDEKGVERIFMPYVVYEKQDDKQTDNSFNCPIVSGYSDVIRSAMTINASVDSPVINFSDEKLLGKQLTTYLKGLGVKTSTCKRAIKEALETKQETEALLRQRNLEILSQSRKQGNITILLAGRPYHTDPLVQHKISDMIAALGVNVINEDSVRGGVFNKTLSKSLPPQTADSVRCEPYDSQDAETYLVRQWAYTNRIIKAAQWVANQGNDVHFVQMTSFGCGPDAFIQDEVRDILRRHNKPYTLLKIDDVTNIGSQKLRIRSLVESLKNGSSTTTHIHHSLPQTRVFRNQDRKRKILAPFFTEYFSPLMPPLMYLAGYDLEILPPSDGQSAQLGLAYANNEVCYPATLIVGDMIKALKSGKYDTDNIALVMTQTGGQCRATNYTALIKRAMIANGFADVPLITLGVSTAGGDNEQEGFAYPWVKLATITTNAVLFCDVISKFYNAAAVREKTPGAAEALKRKYIRLADDVIRKNDAPGIIRLTEEAAREFDSIVVEKDCPKVGIVGEIFLKFNPFAHQFIADKLTRHGIEVVPPLISPFFLQEFVNVETQKSLGLTNSNMPKFVIRSIWKLIWRQEKKMNKAASAFRYYRPFTSIYEDAEGAKGLVSFAAQFGEGWLLPADIVAFEQSGVHNVISLQPFGCIANHVISKGIEKKLRELYPDLNILSLDFDSGVSSVNVTNRLLLFLDQL